jgi:hypothetical protein
VSYVSERMKALLAHRYTGDPVNDAILDGICEGIAGAMDRLGLIAFGDPDTGVEGSRVLTDPRVAPLWALPHAAQYTGAEMPGRMAGEAEDAYLARARDAVAYPLGIKRGTHEAIRRTAQPLLEGTKNVFIADNYGDEYGILVRTIESETPDPAGMELALAGDYVSGGQRGAIRAELLLTYLTADVVTFAEATLHFSDLPDSVTAENVIREDVT